MRTILIAAALLLPQDAPKSTDSLPSLDEIFRSSEKGIVGLDFKPDGSALVVGGEGFVHVLDLKNFRVVQKEVQPDLVDEILHEPLGAVLVTRSKGPDTVIRLPGSLAPVKFVIDVPLAVTALETGLLPPAGGSCPAAFSDDGRRLALVNGSRGFRVWDLAGLGGPRKFVLEMGFEEVPSRKEKPGDRDPGNRRHTEVPQILLNHATALRFQGDRLWVGMEQGYLQPIDPDVFKPLDDPRDEKTMRGESPAPSKPDPTQVRKAPVRTLKQAHVFQPHRGDVTTLICPEGDATMLTAGMDGKVRFWSIQEILDRKPPANDFDKGKEARPRKTLNGHFAAVSKDGRRLAVAEADGIRCYDMASLSPTSWTPISPKLGVPARVKFSPDGSLLAVTVCACAACDKRDVVYTLGQERMRSHHHGGTLILLSTKGGGSSSRR